MTKKFNKNYDVIHVNYVTGRTRFDNSDSVMITIHTDLAMLSRSLYNEYSRLL